MHMKTNASDQQLVLRAQKGDKRAFDLLVIKYQFKVQAIIGRFLRDRDEISDVAQETFIKAYRALPTFRGESQFYTWVFRIAVNTVKNHLLLQSRRTPILDIDADEAETLSDHFQMQNIETPETNLVCEQLEAEILKAITKLPEDLRTAMTLREYCDLSYDDIAKVMECPKGTVRSRLSRAREIIDRHISKLIDRNS